MVEYAARQLSDTDFEALDSLSFRLENSLMELIDSLQRKRRDGNWMDSFADGDP